MCEILDGILISNKIKQNVITEIKELKQSPCLAVITFKNDYGSNVYLKAKKKICLECGIDLKIITLDTMKETEEVCQIIKKLNTDSFINGIILESPIPGYLNSLKIISSINPLKDVDCITPINQGRLFLNNSDFYPCTPSSVIKILKEYQIAIEGQKCVILGRSNIVGKPLSLMLLNNNATVTICHSKTLNLKEECKKADILISAIGKSRFITESMLKKNAVVVDVGINQDNNLKLCGDVDFFNVLPHIKAITPVPGGVGLVTSAILLENLIKAIKLQQRKNIL